MTAQVPRCGAEHPTETFANTGWFNVWTDPRTREQAPVHCTRLMDRHGNHHTGLGEFLKLVSWPI